MKIVSRTLALLGLTAALVAGTHASATPAWAGSQLETTAGDPEPCCQSPIQEPSPTPPPPPPAPSAPSDPGGPITADKAD